jgi:putative MATE family efflux protein
MIAALAVPALGALAADPLYSLVDTAFVGHLGVPHLGALAIGTAAFNASFWIFSFLAYGVTPRVARAQATGDIRHATAIGVQALFLAVLLGMLVSAFGALLAEPIVTVLGAGPEVSAYAEPYLRIRVLAATPVLIAQVGQGYLRGMQDTRTPTYIVVAGALANVVLGWLLIFPAGFGIEGAAWAVVICQTAVALSFVLVLRRRMSAPRWRVDVGTMRSLARVGGELAIRTGSILAALTVATAVAARMGTAVVASWQVAMQTFLFLALCLDCVAIAAQALVGRFLGSRDEERARAVTARLMALGLYVGVGLALLLLPFAGPVADLFSESERVTTLAAALLVWIALLQPLAGVAFALDGILIGASDTAFLARAMLGSSLVFGIGLALAAGMHGGVSALAVCMTIWIGVRALWTGLRWRSGAWVGVG